MSNTVYLIREENHFVALSRGSESVGRMTKNARVLAALKISAPSPNSQEWMIGIYIVRWEKKQIVDFPSSVTLSREVFFPRNCTACPIHSLCRLYATCKDIDLRARDSSRSIRHRHADRLLLIARIFILPRGIPAYIRPCVTLWPYKYGLIVINFIRVAKLENVDSTPVSNFLRGGRRLL